jgi:hypothetical protein
MSKINPIVVIGDEEIRSDDTPHPDRLSARTERRRHSSYRAELRDTLVNAVDFLVTGS